MRSLLSTSKNSTSFFLEVKEIDVEKSTSKGNRHRRDRRNRRRSEIEGKKSTSKRNRHREEIGNREIEEIDIEKKSRLRNRDREEIEF